MKATDLMIGDWVLCDRNAQSDYEFDNVDYQPYKIANGEDIDYAFEQNMIGDADVYQPIPLTAEIMNKNFPKPNGDYWVEGDFPIIGYSIPCITDGNRPYVEVSIYDPARVMEFEMFFHYVHELQHALRLCGIEKEIEL